MFEDYEILVLSCYLATFFPSLLSTGFHNLCKLLYWSIDQHNNTISILKYKTLMKYTLCDLASISVNTSIEYAAPHTRRPSTHKSVLFERDGLAY